MNKEEEVVFDQQLDEILSSASPEIRSLVESHRDELKQGVCYLETLYDNLQSLEAMAIRRMLCRSD